MNFNQTQLVVADPKSGKEDEWENEAATNNDDNTTILPSVLIESLMQGPAQLPAINLGMAEQLDPGSEEERGRDKHVKTFTLRYHDFEHNGDSY